MRPFAASPKRSEGSDPSDPSVASDFDIDVPIVLWWRHEVVLAFRFVHHVTHLDRPQIQADLMVARPGRPLHTLRGVRRDDTRATVEAAMHAWLGTIGDREPATH